MTPSSSSVVEKKQQQQQEADDIYDDACDLGQFCMNPCWFLFVKAQKKFSRSKKNHDDQDKETQTPIRAAVSMHTIHMQQIFYILAVFGSWAIIFRNGYPFFRTSPDVSNIHLTIGYGVFALCVTSWSVARWTPPGSITAATMPKHDNYPYDHLLYLPHQICPTVGIRKLPRSKYDRYTQKHVPRFDHFCGWINQSVGEENYRCFLVFLAVHAFMCVYGTVITGTALWGAHQTDNTNTTLSRLETILAVLSLDYALSAVLLLIGGMAVVLGTFLSFHGLLIYKGMTTNEYYKWNRMYERHALATNEYEFRNLLYEKPTKSVATNTNDDIQQLLRRHVNTTGDEEATAASRPPPPQEAPATSSSHQHPGPFPVNLYNLGFLANLYEVVFPRSLRVEATATTHSKDL